MTPHMPIPEMQREGLLRRWLIHPNLSDTPRDCACYSIVKAG